MYRAGVCRFTQMSETANVLVHSCPGPQNSVEAEVLLESIVLFRNYSKAIQLMPEID